MAHSPQARHSVSQLAASWHHVAMVTKREMERAEVAALKKARIDAEIINVPVEKPVGAARQAAAASLTASSGPRSVFASTQDRVIIRFPEGEAAAKALGGEQLRVLMEAVADDVCRLLGAYFTAAETCHRFCFSLPGSVHRLVIRRWTFLRTCRVHEVELVQGPVV